MDKLFSFLVGTQTSLCLPMPLLEAKGGDGGRPRPPLTGNTQADADIVAFYEAREQLLARQAKK